MQNTTDHCNVCSSSLGTPVFHSQGSTTLTSLCQLRPNTSNVFYCGTCSHTQTSELADIEQFYDNEYKILTGSEEEDQLCTLPDGSRIFRLELQAKTVLDKVQLPHAARVLDYGAAKGSSLRKMLEQRPDIQPHVFDVSDMYVPFWNGFLTPQQWRCHEVPSAWTHRFDLVTSFYVLEHIADLRNTLTIVHRLLANEGVFFFTVPNMFENIADFVVSDHVNHFSEPSLKSLLIEFGFDSVEIDTDAIPSAFVVTARKATVNHSITPATLANHESVGLEAIRGSVQGVANYWRSVSGVVAEFESTLAPGDRAAIYGAGFYGSYLYANLANKDIIDCFLDANPHQHGKSLFDKPIIAPTEIPADINTVLVGLNPRLARGVIAGIEAWKTLPHRYFYLPEADC